VEMHGGDFDPFYPEPFLSVCLHPCGTPLHGTPYSYFKNYLSAGHWWLTPVILATWEAEIGKIMVQGHPGQIICETLPLQKINQSKNGLELWFKH
jgi:hypothetical protein